MTDPYEQDRKDLADAIAWFLINTGTGDFVLPNFIGKKTLAFGDPEVIREHLPVPKTASEVCTEFHRVRAVDLDARLKAELANAQREQ